jgi:hypothetical protein
MLNIRVELTPRGMPVGQRQAGQHGQRTFARRMLRAVVDLLAGTASYLESSLGYGAHPTIYATKGSSG